MRPLNFCPLMFWLLGIQVDCAYPDLSECGFTLIEYENKPFALPICKHMVKEIGLTAMRQIALVKLSELMRMTGGD